jgi:hypothetical protein
LVTIVMLETEDAQGRLLIDQVNTEVPTVSPVMVVLGLFGVVITPDPETFTQTPVPESGVFPAIIVFGVDTQIVWLGPALAEVGGDFTVIETVDVEGTHVPVVIVQAKIFTPRPIPVIVVFRRFGFVIVPDPDIKVHKPVLAPVGLLPAMVALEPIHNV